MKLLIFLFLSLTQVLFAQDTGPVYNFNFYNKEVNLPGAIPNNTASKSNASATPNQQSVTDETRKTARNYFDKSLLDPTDNFIGIGATYIVPLNDKDQITTHKMFSANILMMSSLIGLKYINEKYAYFNEDIEYGNTTLDYSSSKFGINKFIPFTNHIALEVGAFYEKGKIEYWSRNYDYAINTNFNAGSALVGINFFTGNLVAGVQYQQRFAFKAKDAGDSGYANYYEIAKQGNLTANLGIYF